ncbi:MAG: flagellar protein FlaG [Firmicutes bacterium]|nr:flagellar protein FlaG [Bacillota bacterium]
MRIDPIFSVNPNGNTAAAGKLAENTEASSQNQSQDNIQVKPTEEQLQQALTKVKEGFEKANVEFEYSVDATTNREVVKVIDKDTKEVIRQFPPEEILNMLQKMYEMLGVLVDKRV